MKTEQPAIILSWGKPCSYLCAFQNADAYQYLAPMCVIAEFPKYATLPWSSPVKSLLHLVVPGLLLVDWPRLHPT